jgi:hypothetical protein
MAFDFSPEDELRMSYDSLEEEAEKIQKMVRQYGDMDREEKKDLHSSIEELEELRDDVLENAVDSEVSENKSDDYIQKANKRYREAGNSIENRSIQESISEELHFFTQSLEETLNRCKDTDSTEKMIEELGDNVIARKFRRAREEYNLAASLSKLTSEKSKELEEAMNYHNSVSHTMAYMRLEGELGDLEGETVLDS